MKESSTKNTFSLHATSTIHQDLLRFEYEISSLNFQIDLPHKILMRGFRY